MWLDGRQPEADPDPHYLGNAIGHWDGDTLVIESNGFKDSADGKFWLDDNANPQSSQAKVMERWSRPDFQHLDLELTYTDPVYYTKPVTYARHWVIGAPGEALEGILVRVEHAVGRRTISSPARASIGADGNRGFGPNGQVLPDLPLGSVTDSSRGTGYWLLSRNRPSQPPEGVAEIMLPSLSMMSKCTVSPLVWPTRPTVGSPAPLDATPRRTPSARRSFTTPP